ncbi:hypothetical protein B0T10DRAFT_556248 [Thelonectria olida]|uniref:Uncharacterized protein n=1 Tax=Thelonectria olida TaxID=1576542 RepID=A0A9P8WJ66_9HYPO|nr:hypothetical protein B0T10DRAFT_556248 [Thelonectria olida]
MCYQIYLYTCRHMKRELHDCYRILRQKTSFFGTLVECFSPVEPCKKLVGGLARLNYPCETCTPRPAAKWPLWDKRWAFPTMCFDDDELDEEKHWTGPHFTQNQRECTLEDTTGYRVPDVYVVTDPVEEAALRRVPNRRWSCETLDGREDGVLVSTDRPQHSLKVPYQHKPSKPSRPIHRVSACENLRFAFRDSLSVSSLEQEEAVEKVMDTRKLAKHLVESSTEYCEPEPYVVHIHSGVFDDLSDASRRLWDEYEARNAMGCFADEDNGAFE